MLFFKQGSFLVYIVCPFCTIHLIFWWFYWVNTANNVQICAWMWPYSMYLKNVTLHYEMNLVVSLSLVNLALKKVTCVNMTEMLPLFYLKKAFILQVKVILLFHFKMRHINIVADWPAYIPKSCTELKMKIATQWLSQLLSVEFASSI